VLQSVHAGAFGSLLYLPVSQGEHTRSAVADGAFETYAPAAQVAQVVHEATLAVVLKVPATHASQARSAVAVGSESTRVPGAQTLTAAQAVAGLLSLSHVPSPQVVAGLVEPAQYWPGTQASQTVALVADPAAI
jgi:hypothetical protein